MKKLLACLFLMSVSSYAQYTINGTLTPVDKNDWVILYKTEGTKEIFVQNTTIQKDSITIDGKQMLIGNFQFTLPENSKPGSYRATYQLEDNGFVDFIFNKENVSFICNPKHPTETIVFTESQENIFFNNYLDAIYQAQQSVDSIQVASFSNPQINYNQEYKKALSNIDRVQNLYLEESKLFFVHSFIKALRTNNLPEVIANPQEYLANVRSTFFKHIDFENQTLLKTSFLVDKITDYVFYLNYSEDKATQQQLYKESIDDVFAKISNDIFKRDLVHYLITLFEKTKNIDIIDYLFSQYFDKLPASLQNKEFKNKKLELLATEIGRVAPNFSWKEAGKTLQLSELKSASNYILVFWSTSCPHCTKEIPELHTFMTGNTKAKVIAFAMEKEASEWIHFKEKLFGWHNVLGLGKWDNDTAKKYLISATPTYIILDANKKIIAKPEELKDVKAFINQL